MTYPPPVQPSAFRHGGICVICRLLGSAVWLREAAFAGGNRFFRKTSELRARNLCGARFTCRPHDGRTATLITFFVNEGRENVMNDQKGTNGLKNRLKELSKEEMEKVQGGIIIALFLIVARPEGEDPVLSITRVDPA